MSIEIRDLVKTYGAVEVLRSIGLTIAGGELIALLGPSGSGKTTLLRILAGLDWPQSGSIRVDDRDWLSLPTQQRRVGFVFQHYALFEHLTVAENVAFGLRVRPRRERPANAEILSRVARLLDLVQIGTLGQRYPLQLSGGQRQRVALARAIAIEPQVLLLDEPFGALDARIRKDLRRWLRELHQQLGTTTIFVTHDQEEAFELADRVALMEDGRIRQIGTPDDLYRNPATPSVVRFLGEANELPALPQDGALVVRGVDISALGRLPPDARTLFVRARDIELKQDRGAAARVRRIVSTGADFRVEVDLPGAAKLTEVDVPRDVVLAANLQPGDAVALRARRGHAFAQAS
jgi:sulfate transport system ATP-binding protein